MKEVKLTVLPSYPNIDTHQNNTPQCPLSHYAQEQLRPNAQAHMQSIKHAVC